MRWRKSKLHGEEKFDVTKIQISENYAIGSMFRENKSDEKSPLAKNQAISYRWEEISTVLLWLLHTNTSKTGLDRNVYDPGPF